MSNRPKNHLYPIFFVLILFSICIFIVGVQYGRSVAGEDAVIDYVRKIPPTKAVTPEAAPPLGFKYLESKDCGISFLYPDTFTNKTTNGNKIRLEGNNQFIAVSCDSPLIEAEVKVASVSLTLKEATVSAQKGVINNKYTDEQLLFTYIHPETDKEIEVLISEPLYELFSESLEFLK